MSYVSPIKIGYTAEPEEGWTDKIGKYLAGEVDNLVLQSCVKVGCHVDKDELEKALRYDRGQYEKWYEDGKRDAAAAIEELRKVNRELRELYEDAVRKLPNRGEWISVNPMVDSVQCSVCGGQLFSAELETPYCPYCGAKMEVQDGKRCD